MNKQDNVFASQVFGETRYTVQSYGFNPLTADCSTLVEAVEAAMRRADTAGTRVFCGTRKVAHLALVRQFTGIASHRDALGSKGYVDAWVAQPSADATEEETALLVRLAFGCPTRRRGPR